jgi:heme-degrading monooxygenase HmoA
MDMTNPSLIVLVRFGSPLSLEEVLKVVEERADAFRAFQGLQQKYYLQDPGSGDYAGLYLWESEDAFTVYRDSELRATIADAYQVVGEPRVEVYRVMKTLHDDTA